MRIGTVVWRGIAARRARTVATTIAVAAAVSFLSGSYVLTDTTDAAVRHAAARATGGVSAVVTDARGFGGSVLTGAPTLPPDLVDRVRAVPGVVAADGIVEGYAMPLDRAGHGVSSLAGIGMSLPSDPRLRLVSLRDGHWPSGSGEVVIDATTASKLGVTVGGPVRVALKTGARTFAVAGTVGFGGAENVAGLTVVGFAPAAAQTLLGTGADVAAVEAVGAPDVAPATLTDRITRAIGGGYTVRTGSEQAEQVAGQVGGVTAVIGTVLQAFAAVALVVAALLIANIFTVTVAQRIRELALLRCIGAGRGQAARLVLTEASLTGAAGAAVGLPAGIGLALALRAVLAAFGLPLPAGPLVLAGRTVTASLVVGLGVTVVAAGAAARRASRSRPLAALTAASTASDSPGVGVLRRIVAGVALAGGSALLATAVSVPPVGLGALLLLCGAGLAGPVLVRPATAPSRGVLTLMSGFCGRLAGRQMLRHPRRVAGTTGTLAVAVATVSIVAALAATIVAGDSTGVRRSLRADFVVGTTPGSGSTVTPEVLARVRGLSGVEAAIGVPCGIFKAPAVSEKACAVDPATLPALLDLGVSAGRLSDLTAGTVAVSALSAGRVGWRVGQVVPITTPLGGSRPARIVALYTYSQVVGDYLMPLTDFERDYPPADQGLVTMLVGAAPGQGQTVRAGLTTLLSDYPQATLDDRAGYARRVGSGIELIANMMTALLALSLLIGLLAVVTSLALSVLERTREIGLLRAVGAETRHIRTLIRTEALTTVITGCVVGLVLGLAIGWPLARGLMNGHLLAGPAIPVPLMAAILPAAGLAGLLAAAVPARRAVRLGVLAALQAEG